MHEIDLTQASGHLAELIQEARKGGEVILTENGHPVAKLMALPRRQTPGQPRLPGTAKGWQGDIEDWVGPLEDFAEYM